MASQTEKPAGTAKIKKTRTEQIVACKICNKTFASEKALANHGRLLHLESVTSGLDICVKIESLVEPVEEPIPFTKHSDHHYRKAEFMSSLTPGDLLMMASSQTSYVLVKDDNPYDSADEKPQKQKVAVKPKAPKIPKQRDPPVIPNGPFKCVHQSCMDPSKLCDRIFASCCDYSRHMRDDHPRRRKGVKCQICEKPLEAEGTDELPYVCQYCGLGFAKLMFLSDHKSIAHARLKPFQCSICQKRFTLKSGLIGHMRTHTGEKPFECTYCPKKFGQRASFDQHMRIHTNSKPHKCVLCAKSFCQSMQLQQHMRSHTNVAPFQCEICKKRFKLTNHLTRHVKIHLTEMTEEQGERYDNNKTKKVKRESNDKNETVDENDVIGDDELSNEDGKSVNEVYTGHYVADSQVISIHENDKEYIEFYVPSNQQESESNECDQYNDEIVQIIDKDENDEIVMNDGDNSVQGEDEEEWVAEYVSFDDLD